MPFACPELHDRPHAGWEKPFGSAGIARPVDQRVERHANQVRDLPRTLTGLDPGVGRDTRVGGADGLAVGQIVAAVDAVDEDHARLGVGVGRAHDLVPQVARRQDLEGGAAETQFPRRVLPHRAHEGVGDEDREIEHAEPAGRALRLDEGLDVGMVAAQRRHHRAAAIARAHDGAAHRVPHVHEGQRARGVGADPFDRRALGPQRREIVADAAALLHRQRRLAQMGEDAGHVVRNRAHDEAVEEGDVAPAAGPGKDASGRQKLEVSQRLGKAAGPKRRVALGCGQCRRDAAPAVLDGLVHNGAVRPAQAVLHVPDLLRNGGDNGHGCPSRDRECLAPNRGKPLEFVRLSLERPRSRHKFPVCFHAHTRDGV